MDWGHILQRHSIYFLDLIILHRREKHDDISRMKYCNNEHLESGRRKDNKEETNEKSIEMLQNGTWLRMVIFIQLLRIKKGGF